VRQGRLLRFVAEPSCDKAHGEAGHPLVRSIEPGEDWCWCAVDDTYFVVDLPQR
jgi:hypothetical protein